MKVQYNGVAKNIQTQTNTLNTCLQNVLSGSAASFVNVCATSASFVSVSLWNASINCLYAPSCSFTSVSFSSLNGISSSTIACVSTLSSDIQTQLNNVSTSLKSLQTGTSILSNMSVTTASMNSVSITSLNVSLLNGISSSTIACISNVSFDIQSQLNSLLSNSNISVQYASLQNASILTSCNILCNTSINGSLNVSGNMYAKHGYFTDFVTVGYSDDRMKNRISPLTNCLEKLLPLSTFTYVPQSWVCEQLGVECTPHVGLSAQEVSNVFPEIIAPLKIQQNDNNYMTIRYEHFIPVLIQAIRELYFMIETKN